MKFDTVPELERFLALQLQTLGESREVADTICMLGDLFLKQNNPNQAEVQYQRALKMLEKLSDHGSSRHLEVQQRLQQLRTVGQARGGKQPPGQQSAGKPPNGQVPVGQAPRAVPQQSQQEAPSEPDRNSDAKAAKPVRDMNWDPRVTQQFSHPEVSAALAAFRTGVQPATESSPSFKVKDEILDAIHDVEIELKFHRQEGGGQTIALADLLTKMADVQCRARLYHEAETTLTEALEIRESCLGAEHFSVSTDLANLARVYFAQELFDKAEPLFRQAILLRKKLLGPEHIKVGELERQYAKLLRRMNRLIEAEAVEMHVARIYS